MKLPADVWASMPNGNLKYQAVAYLRDHTLEEAIVRFYDSAVGTQIPGRSAEAMQVVKALEMMRD